MYKTSPKCRQTTEKSVKENNLLKAKKNQHGLVENSSKRKEEDINYK